MRVGVPQRGVGVPQRIWGGGGVSVIQSDRRGGWGLEFLKKGGGGGLGVRYLRMGWGTRGQTSSVGTCSALGPLGLG